MSPMFPVKVLPSANAGIYDDEDLASYLSQSRGDEIQYQGDLRDKRGMCRPGFTYQAILRDCVPSLGVGKITIRCNKNEPSFEKTGFIACA
ncbi:hypothetical protein DPMN_064412 [Dreissena polymorpha]|uniref:Uncharacterized protein n=1 Tax=Dreissena polymorpha TaxID=45954 RepID=A0A9D4CDR7_DREPO|nr:hypothetical protein DPMN_064412 [Dreissena polymorpha]